MPHDVSLIALLAAGFGLAMIFGYLASLLKMPPLVGRAQTLDVESRMAPKKFFALPRLQRHRK